MLMRSWAPLLVVMRITPAAALEPYMEAEAASLRTEMFSMSSGLTEDMSPGTPSMMTSGVESPIVVIPLTFMSPLSLLGSLLVLVTVTPAIAP